ncbi:hypothetical protein [Streptomyces sp. 8L]|uniref:hypothetical protein n=1 Tax=Streptomyces sp. 8L TaxID=2877242 RepID=UPI001CD57842|nr:hypothetical protein [Streptomyces sp. 8L]MCA1221438.1 hypothetical protein [Streptomyces sp. 8L]
MRNGYARLRSARERWGSRVQLLPQPDDWPRLTPAHLSVLDGRTLNVSVAVPSGLTPSTAVLVLGDRTTPAVVPLRLRKAEGGGVRAEGTAVVELLDSLREKSVLPAGVSRYLLGEGSWKASVEFTDAAGGKRHFALATPPPLMQDGPTVPDPVREDGTSCRLGTSATGRAHLTIGRDGPGAEVELVRFDWTGITVRGRLVNAPADAYAGGEVELVRRTGRLTHTVPVRWDGERFEATVAVSDLPGVTPREQVWDARLCCSGLKPLKISRKRHDLRVPRTVHRMPDRLLTGDDDRSVRINPYYTPVGSLALRGALVAAAGGEK